jgi:hypothetical protein
VRQNFTVPHVWDNGRTPCRMLKKARLLTHPTLAGTSPARHESAKTASLPRDALVPSKAATSHHFIRGGRDDPNCAQHSHPPTHWQIFFTHPTLRLLRNRFPGTCHLPGRGPADSPTAPEGVGRLLFTARIEPPPLYRGGSASKKNGLPTPSHSSEAARCASTGIVPATPPPFSASC